MTNFDATARINVDLSSFTRAAREAGRDSGAWNQSLNQLQQSLSRIEPLEKNRAASLNRTLAAYRSLASAVGSYASTVNRLSQSNVSASAAAAQFNTAMVNLGRSVSSVRGISESEYARINRTVTLYERVARAVNAYATALDRMAQINQRAQAAQERSNQAKARAAQQAEQLRTQEQRTAAATASASAAQSRAATAATAAADRQAAAAQRSALAETNLATAKRRSVTATNQSTTAAVRLTTARHQATAAAQRAAAATSNAAAAAARAAVAQERLTRATQQGAVANIDFSTSMFSLRSALTDYQGLLNQVLDILRAIPAATFSAAIEQEQAFAHIARVTQDTTVDLQAMRAEFQRMATEIPLAFGELTNIAVLGSQIGIAREELLRFTDTVAKFSATNAVSQEQTALLAGRIAQLGNVPEAEFVNLLSGISELGSNSAATEEAILRMTEQIATSTRAAGISTEGMIGLAGAIASLGIRPELARGALQRTFGVLRDVVDEAGERLDALAATMGLTAEEARALQQSNPEEFFMRFVEGVGNAQESGDSLRAVLRDIGIYNTRDVELLSRLGINYDFLAQQIDLANDSYAEATFLNTEANRIFGTTQSALTRLSNAWQNFRANAVDPMLRVLSPALQTLAAGLNAISQSPIASFLAGLAVSVATAGAAFVAYRVALTGIAAGLIAMRQVQQQSNAVTISANGIWNLYRQTQTQATTAVVAQTAATRVQTTAVAANAASTGLFATATARTATAARGAATAMRGLTASMGPIGLVMTAISVLMAGSLITGLGRTRDRMNETARAAIDAAGGMSAFRSAVKQDTQAVEEGSRALRTYASSKSTVTEETRRELQATIESTQARIRTLESLHGTYASLRQVARGTGEAAEEAQGYIEQIDKLGKEVLDAKNALDGTTAAFGEQAAAMQRAAIESALYESELVKSEDAMVALREAGIEFGPIIEKSFKDPQGAIDDLNKLLTQATEGMFELERVGNNVQYSADQEQIQSWQHVFDAVEVVTEIVNQFDGELQQVANTNVLLGGSMNQAAGDTLGVGDALDSAAESADGFGEEMAEASEVATIFANTLGGFGTRLSAWEAAVQGANETARAEFQRTTGSVEGFSDSSTASLGAFRQELENILESQRNWAENMIQVAARVPNDVAIALADLGPSAAPLVAELVNATDKEISELVPLFRATSEEAAMQLATGLELSLPALEGIGRSAGAGLAQTLSNELARAAREGGDFSGAINRYLELVEQINRAEANPLIKLNDLEARQTLDEFERDVRRKSESGSLDPRAWAELDVQRYQDNLTGVETLAGRVTSQNLLGPVGNAELETGQYDSELSSTEREADQTTRANSIGPEGTATLSGARYNDQMARIRDAALRLVVTLNNAFARIRPVMTTNMFYSQLSQMQTAAARAGNNIQRSLTRNAVVNVQTRVNNQAQRFADGGWISGPGGPRADRVPVLASDGEFITNAASAQRWGPLLEWLNDNARNTAIDPGVLASVMPNQQVSAGAGNANAARPTTFREGNVSTAPQTQTVINVHNTYPQAEPTSTTINRSLAYAAALEGVGT